MRKKLQKFITGQFGNPSGFIGKLIGNRMAKGNVYDAQWTISLLDIQPDHRVLEIGFGPGISTKMASEKAFGGFVAGIDHSSTMVQSAVQRNADGIRSGKVELKQGEADSLPYSDRSFDIVYSLHSIYFWKNPLACLIEIKRVLKPGGLLAITIQPRSFWKREVDTSIMTLYSGEELASLFSEAGFQNVRVEVSVPKAEGYLECILGSAIS